MCIFSPHVLLNELFINVDGTKLVLDDGDLLAVRLGEYIVDLIKVAGIR